MTIRQIITDAFRESNVIAVGADPEAEEFEEALRRLNTIYQSMLGHELGEPVKTINENCVYDTVSANSRLINPTKTVKLYCQPQDGERLYVVSDDGVTIDPNGRTIEGATSLTLTDAVNRQWFYRDDLGDWLKINDLVAEDPSPLPEEFDDLLVTVLAFRLNPRYGAETNDSTQAVLQRMRSQIRARYRQNTEVASEDGLIFLPSNRWSRIRGPFNYFNRGR